MVTFKAVVLPVSASVIFDRLPVYCTPLESSLWIRTVVSSRGNVEKIRLSRLFPVRMNSFDWAESVLFIGMDYCLISVWGLLSLNKGFHNGVIDFFLTNQ